MPNRRPLTALGEVWERYLQPHLLGDTVDRLPLAEDTAAESQFAINMGFLTEGIRFVREHGATPVILHTPERDDVVEHNGNSERKYESWRRRFLTLAERERVPLLNLPKAWQTDPDAPLYFRDHVHLTARGTAAAAKGLCKLLQASCAQVLSSGAQVSPVAVVHHSP